MISRNSSSRIFFLLVFLTSTHPLFAITQQKDFWQWNSLSIDKKLSKKFSVSLDEEVRLFHNMSQLNLCYTNLGLSFKPNSLFKIGLTYRFIQKKQDDKSYSFRHRLMLDLIAKKKWNQFTLSYRARLQSQMRDINSSENGRIPETSWRSKFDLKYELTKKLSPYVSAEFRYQIKNIRLEEADSDFNRGRYYVGFDYDISKKLNVGLYYMFQQDININFAEHSYVFGTSIGISL